MVYIFCYLLLVLPVWYSAVRVLRVPLHADEIARLEAEVAEPLAAALPVTITAYLVCPGPAYGCLEYRELSGLAARLGEAVLQEAGLSGTQAPLQVRLLQDAPGSCTASSWAAPGRAAQREKKRDQLQRALQAAERGVRGRGGGSDSSGGGGGGGDSGGAGLSGCHDMASSEARLRGVLGLEEREFEDWVAKELSGEDRPGNYHLFLIPDPWLSASGVPHGFVGRRRIAVVRYPPGRRASHGSVVRLAAMMAAPAFASFLGGSAAASASPHDPGAKADASQPPLPLPLSPAAQLHLSFSLCNAHPSPHAGGGGGGATSTDGGGGGGGSGASSAALVWSFAAFEAQFLTPLKQALSPAARLTVSSQVLYFTPARVNASWDERRRTFVLPYSDLPFFVDSAWPLDPGRTGLPASAAGGGDLPYDVDVVVAGSRAVNIGEVMSLPPPPAGSAAAGRGGGGAAAAALPHLLPPPAAEALPPAVLNAVLFAPPPTQRPLVLLGPDGEPAPANSFRVPGWGMLQVLNQVPPPGQITAPVQQDAMESFAVEVVTQLRQLLGLGPARRRLLRLARPPPPPTPPPARGSAAAGGTTGAGGGEGDDDSNGDAVGAVSLLSALRTGFAPWEVDALLRRRVWADARAAAATLGSLLRLLAAVPTLALPRPAGELVRRSAGALAAALARAAEGRYEEASRAAQEARSWAEAAFSDPSLSARLNVPDTHHVGVYLPFCLPALVPVLQALAAEVRRLRRKPKKALSPHLSASSGDISGVPEGLNDAAAPRTGEREVKGGPSGQRGTERGDGGDAQRRPGSDGGGESAGLEQSTAEHTAGPSSE